ncbi:universal stress protein [bacterium]|nr:universal stress protein [bacterium]
MFDYVLYPTDFSEPSRKAFKYLVKMKDAGTKKILLMHVVDRREVSTMATMEGFSSVHYLDIFEDIKAELHKRAEKELDKMAHELRHEGFEIELRLMYGVPFEAIVEVAENEKVSCIVIGSHGKSLVSGMLLGSTSEKVLRKAKCPVFVVK